LLANNNVFGLCSNEEFDFFLHLIPYLIGTAAQALILGEIFSLGFLNINHQGVFLNMAVRVFLITVRFLLICCGSAQIQA
jgi:hypothetical protein